MTQYCTFYIDKHLFGVDVVKVQEVIRYQEMTRVPLASDVIEGLINLRGQIVPALEMRTRLDFPAREPDQLPMNVIVRTAEGGVSLLVDEIGDVLELSDDILEQPPQNLQGVAKELIEKTYKLERELMLVLNVEKTVSFNDRGTKNAA